MPFGPNLWAVEGLIQTERGREGEREREGGGEREREKLSIYSVELNLD